MTENLFPYPKTPRRSWVDLAEAVRQLSDTGEYASAEEALTAGQRVTKAISELPMDRSEWGMIRYVFTQATTEQATREEIATSLAALLTGREKFDVERFIHHATSDSDADDDGDEGKWSYNRTHQAEAQKTTIEVLDDGGDAAETVVL